MRGYQDLSRSRYECHRRTHITSLLMLVLRKDVRYVSLYGLLGKTDRNWQNLGDRGSYWETTVNRCRL